MTRETTARITVFLKFPFPTLPSLTVAESRTDHARRLATTAETIAEETDHHLEDPRLEAAHLRGTTEIATTRAIVTQTEAAILRANQATDHRHENRSTADQMVQDPRDSRRVVQK